MPRFKGVALFIGNKFYKKMVGAFPSDYDFRKMSIFFEPEAINRNGKKYFFKFKRTKRKYNNLLIFKLFLVSNDNPYDWDDKHNTIKGAIPI